MDIWIDSREKGRCKNAAKYYLRHKHNPKIQTLDFGDYVFNNSVVFEYKGINDLVNSIKDKSVFNEAVNQAQNFTYHYVIIVGDVVTTLNRNWNEISEIKKHWGSYSDYIKVNTSNITGAICRLRCFSNVIKVRTEQDAYKVMLHQAQKCIEPKTYGGIVRPKLKTFTPAEYVLCGVSGVSSKKSQEIIDRLNIKNLADLMNCTTEDFLRVKGIGKRTAIKINKWVHKEK